MTLRAFYLRQRSGQTLEVVVENVNVNGLEEKKKKKKKKERKERRGNQNKKKTNNRRE